MPIGAGSKQPRPANDDLFQLADGNIVADFLQQFPPSYFFDADVLVNDAGAQLQRARAVWRHDRHIDARTQTRTQDALGSACLADIDS